jgi:hypothetical protein
MPHIQDFRASLRAPCYFIIPGGELQGFFEGGRHQASAPYEIVKNFTD